MDLELKTIAFLNKRRESLLKRRSSPRISAAIDVLNRKISDEIARLIGINREVLAINRQFYG